MGVFSGVTCSVVTSSLGANCGFGVQHDGSGVVPTFANAFELPAAPSDGSIAICLGCVGPGDVGWTAGMTCATGTGTSTQCIAKGGVWRSK